MRHTPSHIPADRAAFASGFPRRGGRGVVRALAYALILAGPAAAQEDAPDLPPAPDWFVEAVVDITTAQRIAHSCTALEVDIGLVQEVSNQTMARLMSEGYDISRDDGGMLPSREKFAQRQQAFMERHDLAATQITEDMVCAAGRAEMEDTTGIGRLLLEADR